MVRKLSSGAKILLDHEVNKHINAQNKKRVNLSSQYLVEDHVQAFETVYSVRISTAYTKTNALIIMIIVMIMM